MATHLRESKNVGAYADVKDEGRAHSSDQSSAPYCHLSGRRDGAPDEHQCWDTHHTNRAGGYRNPGFRQRRVSDRREMDRIGMDTLSASRKFQEKSLVKSTRERDSTTGIISRSRVMWLRKNLRLVYFELITKGTDVYLLGWREKAPGKQSMLRTKFCQGTRTTRVLCPCGRWEDTALVGDSESMQQHDSLIIILRPIHAHLSSPLERLHG